MTFACISRVAKQPPKELLSKWVKSLLSEDGIAIKIVRDNADQDALKLTRSSLLLYDKAGGFTRTKDMLKAATGEIVKRARKQSFTTSDTPGQLNYKARPESPILRRKDSTAISPTGSPKLSRSDSRRKLSPPSTIKNGE